MDGKLIQLRNANYISPVQTRKQGFTFPEMHHWIQVSIAVLLASLLCFVDAFRQLVDAPSWAAITVVTVHEQNQNNRFKRSMFRMIGTIFGALLGFVVVSLMFVLPPMCFQCSYKPYVMAVIVAIGSGFFSTLKLFYPQYLYVFSVSAISLIVTVLGEFTRSDLYDYDDYHHYISMTERITTVFLGILSSLMVGYLYSYFITIDHSEKLAPVLYKIHQIEGKSVKDMRAIYSLIESVPSSLSNIDLYSLFYASYLTTQVAIDPQITEVLDECVSAFANVTSGYKPIELLSLVDQVVLDAVDIVGQDCVKSYLIALRNAVNENRKYKEN